MGSAGMEDILEGIKRVEAEAFASSTSSSALCEQLRGNLQRLLQLAWTLRAKGKTYALAKHHSCVQQFELEQLWGLLQVDNSPARRHASSLINKLKTLETPIHISHPSSPNTTDSEDDAESGESSSDSSKEEKEEEEEEAGKSADEDDDDDEDENLEKSGDDVDDDDDGSVEKSIGETPELDDEFFKFEEMERFTQQMEELDAQQARLQELYEKERAAKEEKEEKEEGESGEEFSESEDETEEKDIAEEELEEEEDFGLLYDSLEEEEEQEEEKSKKRGGGGAKYGDFYGDGEGAAQSSLSSFEKRQAAMRERLRELEQKLVKEKDWEMRGEAAARSRPENSLLEKGDLDVKYSSRPAPVITEEITETIEDVIKRRIAAEDFDDVVRKLPQDERAENTKEGSTLELSTEKSKKGLGDEYAQAYEKQVLKQSTEEEKAQTEEQEEIKAMFTALCHKLNALTNFHFTPKPPKESVKIVKKNVAAIQMEEALPMSVSTADTAAPEEVFSIQKGKESAMGKSEKEMSQEERKRLRQSRKAARRKRKRQRAMEEKVVSKLNFGLGNKHAKQTALRSIRNQKGMHGQEDKSGVDYTKSRDFFRKLQTEQDEGAVSTGGLPKRKKQRSEESSNHFKL